MWPTACFCEGQSGIKDRIQGHEIAHKLEFPLYLSFHNYWSAYSVPGGMQGMGIWDTVQVFIVSLRRAVLTGW